MEKREKQKKKRSPNFTNEEKEILYSLVAKYKNVIDTKQSGAYSIHKKKEAWAAITKKYNSICTSGPRDADMLKHFYTNVKHRVRKVSASENKKKYIKKQQFKNFESVSTVDENEQKYLKEEPHKNLQSVSKVDENKPTIEVPVKSAPLLETISSAADDVSIIDESTIQDLKKKRSDEKKSIMKTGGGAFNPTLTDADHQFLAILDDQIRPDENPYDEAGQYFGDTIEEIVEDTVQIDQEETDRAPVVPQRRRNVPIRKNTKKKPECFKKSAELLKKIYFKKKIELVFYQKKNEMQKFRNMKKNQEFEQKKHEIEMKILKKKLEKAEHDSI